MFDLDHNVRVFVFQYLEAEIQYLLLRQKPKEEWPLGPVIGETKLHFVPVVPWALHGSDVSNH